MNFKKLRKTLIGMILATTMALSGPMAVFAAESTSWTDFMTEVKSNEEILDYLAQIQEDDTSAIEMMYEFLSAEAQGVLSDYRLSVNSLANAINLTEQSEFNEITAKLESRGLTFKQATDKVAQLNKLASSLKADVLNSKFLVETGGNLSVSDEAKLIALINEAKSRINNQAVDLITVDSIKDYINKFNAAATDDMKKDALALARTYNLVAVTPVTPPSSGGPSGGPVTSPSKEAEKAITASLDKLVKKDANLAAVTKDILKDIEKLDVVGAKAVAGPIITNMTSIIKSTEGVANIKEAQDALVTLVQALVSRVTTQDVEIKDGKATLSASKVKEQIKDAEEMIKQLTKEVEKNEIQLTRTVKITLDFEFDKEVAEVAVSIPEGLWKAIDKKANVAVKAKGVELTLEHNTFKEEAYTINIKEENGVVELTTDGTFAQPIVVAFAVDKKIANYPTVFQVIGEDNKLVGGTYDAVAETVKASLKHFSFYTVNESTPKMFTDIGGLTWEKKAVNELSARGYIAGMTEATFVPNANTTRAEFAAMLTRVMPVAEVEGTLNFTDLKEDAWYYKSIATAVNQGWLVGRDNNKFDPAAPVTRQEVASVLSRVLEQKGYLQTEAAEEGVNVAAWAKDAVRLYLREVETKQVVQLDMSKPATRAELSVMIYQVLSK